MTVNSHRLACLLAQGTQQHCKLSTISWQNSPFICNFHHVFLPDQQILPKGADSIEVTQVRTCATIEVTQVKDQVREKGKQGWQERCVEWSSLHNTVSLVSMYNTTVCKKMHACQLEANPSWPWFYTKPLQISRQSAHLSMPSVLPFNLWYENDITERMKCF